MSRKLDNANKHFIGSRIVIGRDESKRHVIIAVHIKCSVPVICIIDCINQANRQVLIVLTMETMEVIIIPRYTCGVAIFGRYNNVSGLSNKPETFISLKIKQFSAECFNLPRICILVTDNIYYIKDFARNIVAPSRVRVGHKGNSNLTFSRGIVINSRHARAKFKRIVIQSSVYADTKFACNASCIEHPDKVCWGDISCYSFTVRCGSKINNTLGRGIRGVNLDNLQTPFLIKRSRRSGRNRDFCNFLTNGVVSFAVVSCTDRDDNIKAVK